MSTWTPAFLERLLPSEELLVVFEQLHLGLHYIPYADPSLNYSPSLPGALALTSRRLVAAWSERGGTRWLHVPWIVGFAERPLRDKKPHWAYQALLLLPNGLGLVVQTLTPDADQARELSMLLSRAMLFLGNGRKDEGVSAVLIDSLREQRQRQQQIRV